MAEEKKTGLNQDFLLDPKKHKELLKVAQEVFNDPSKISHVEIAELSPENPALASKVLLSAYTRALKEEARKVSGDNKESLLDEINSKYSAFIDEFLEKNKALFATLSSSKSNKNGGKTLWQWKNLKKA